MPSLKDNLLHDLAYTKIGLSKSLMRLAIFAKNERRSAKDRNFLCFAVEVDTQEISLFQNKKIEMKQRIVKTTRGENVIANELTYILYQIEKNKLKLKPETLIQILVKQGVHWTCLNIFLETSGTLSFFVVDAAGDKRWINIISFINQFINKPNIYVCEKEIQLDKMNCAWFSLFHAYKVSNYGFEFFHYLNKFKDKFLKNAEGLFASNPILKVEPKRLPSRMLALSQSKKFIENILCSNQALGSEFISKEISYQMLISSCFETIKTPSGAIRESNKLLAVFK